MAKKAIATKQDVSGVPSALADMMERDAGRGVSKDAADNMVPLIYVLQAQSPQVLKRNPAYIEGAEAGSIWLRGIMDPIVDGEVGIIFQPCFFSKDWVEWIPREDGGGFVGRHPTKPGDAERVEDAKNPNREKWVRPNGNQLRETRYHAGLVHGIGSSPLPFVIPMSGSGHSVSRSWMFLMNSKQLPSGATAPSYGQLYKLTTKLRTNAQGEWFTWDVADAGWVSNPRDYEMGVSLHNAFDTGARTAAHEERDNIEDI